jgi:hypothetical protein
MFEGTKQQKTQQLALDFGDKGEARKRWSRGRLVASAQDQPPKESGRERALAQGLIEAMVSGKNPDKALRAVEANKGAPGVDGMKAQELRPYLLTHWPKLRQRLLVPSCAIRPYMLYSWHVTPSYCC